MISTSSTSPDRPSFDPDTWIGRALALTQIRRTEPENDPSPAYVEAMKRLKIEAWWSLRLEDEMKKGAA